MALVLRLKKEDSLIVKTEDGRSVTISFEIISRNRLVTHTEGDRTIHVSMVKGNQKEADDQSRNLS